MLHLKFQKINIFLSYHIQIVPCIWASKLSWIHIGGFDRKDFLSLLINELFSYQRILTWLRIWDGMACFRAWILIIFRFFIVWDQINLPLQINNKSFKILLCDTNMSIPIQLSKKKCPYRFHHLSKLKIEMTTYKCQ